MLSGLELSNLSANTARPEACSVSRTWPGLLLPVPRAAAFCLLRTAAHQILAYFCLLSIPSSHILISAPFFVCFQNEKAPHFQASQPCSCPHIIQLLSQEEGVFAQDLEPAPTEDGIVYPEPSDSPTMDTRQGLCPGQSSWGHAAPRPAFPLSFFS